MGLEQEHLTVKLVMPILFSDRAILDKILIELEKLYGKSDYRCQEFPFIYTDYYNEEMGPDIKRVILSYEKLIRPELLVEIKRTCNRIELDHAVQGKRKVNLDPGILSEGKFMLATTKDQQHRIYITDGIYEEVTLYFRAKDWQPWEWTYPDYASREYRDILLEIRKLYVKQIKN